jgi:sec-independent protein translocase protein TatA
MPNIGPLEIVIVLIIVLVIFGPKRLPDLGRSLGRGMREFKDSVTGKDSDERKAELGASSEEPSGGSQATAPPKAAEQPEAAGQAQSAAEPETETGEPREPAAGAAGEGKT